MHSKDFDAWNKVKKRVEQENRKIYIRSGEIRWISTGVNIGSEIDGKGVSFTRPALIIHTIGSYLTLIVPMSTSVKKVAGYIPFEWEGKTTALCIHQMRIVSQKRVLSRIGRISDKRLVEIKKAIRKFFSI